MALTRLNIGGGKLLIASTLAFGMLTTACQAYSAEQEQLCTGDAMRLCGSEIPDVERVTACMIRQRASLSDGCKSVFQPAPAAAPVAYRPSAGKPSKPINLVPARVK
jgi:glycerol-3-phosphate dehydrogenase